MHIHYMNTLSYKGAVDRSRLQQRPDLHGPDPQLRPSLPSGPVGVQGHREQLRGRGRPAARRPAPRPADVTGAREDGVPIACHHCVVRHRREAASPAQLSRRLARRRAADPSRTSPIRTAESEAGTAGLDTGTAEEDPGLWGREAGDLFELQELTDRRQRVGNRVFCRACVQVCEKNSIFEVVYFVGFYFVHVNYEISYRYVCQFWLNDTL